MKIEAGDIVVVKDGCYTDYPCDSNYNLPRGEGVVAKGGTDLGFLVIDYGGKLSPPVNPKHFTKPETGPVRTVTRKEIVPGVYGVVSIHELTSDDGDPFIALLGATSLKERTVHVEMSAKKLRTTIATLTEIADALEEVK